MDKHLIEEMTRVIDLHFDVSDLNKFLKVCITDKLQDQCIWGEMVLTIHFMLGGASPYIHSVAAYTELLMLAVDMIDDLADKDNKNKPWMKLPHALALNASIALIVAVIGEFGKLKDQHQDAPLPAVGEIQKFLTYAANGQHRDIQNPVIETEESYLSLVLHKSAPLIKLACYVGYSCLEQCESSIKLKIDNMAEHFSIAAQLHNDLRDLIHFDVKHDLKDKKRTFPILFLLNQCSERHPIFHNYYEGNISLEQFLEMKEECLASMYQSGCIEYTQVVQGLYVNQVEEILESIPAQLKWKQQFLQTVVAPYRVQPGELS